MTERDALLRAVCENPDDDTPRLVFADWLQENGDEIDCVRAEFIRLQIRLERMEATPDDGGKTWEEWQYLSGRKLQLQVAHEESWRRDLPTSRGYRVGGQFHRGFVDSVWIIDWTAFARDAEHLFHVVPIQTAIFECTSIELGASPWVVERFARLRTLTFSPYTSLSDEDVLALLAAPFPRLDHLTLGRPVEPYFRDRLRSRFGDRVSCYCA